MRVEQMKRALWYGVSILLLMAAGEAAAQPARCYPGPPLYILRELLGGDFSPERYRSAILAYARDRCANDQVLKLVSPAGADRQDQLNEEVARALCDPESIHREQLAAGEAALVLFCPISKLGAAPSR